jgi:outer membrane protein
MKIKVITFPCSAILTSLSLLLLHAGPASAQLRLSGDIGLGATRAQAQVRGVRAKTEAVPYMNFEYGPAFARIDTFGIKAVPLGYGDVEIVGQYRGDGYKSSELGKRRDSLPLGVGTLQVTPIGAFAIHVLHDVGKSGGNIVQARYLAELKLGRVTVYPEVGAEHQSRAYTGYYYGTTASDAATLGRAYQPGSALNPFAGALVETRLNDTWYANAYVRRTVVDHSVSDSPLVIRRNRDAVLLAVAHRF